MNHGQMTWTGRFDLEGYAVFECAICGESIGLQPDRLPKRLIEMSGHKHSAWTTPEIAIAAGVLGLWDVDVERMEMLRDVHLKLEGVEIKQGESPVVV